MAKFPVFRFQEYGPGGGAAAPANLDPAIRFADRAHWAQIGALRSLIIHKNEFVVSTSFAVCTPPGVQHVYHSRLFDSTDREARAAAAHGDVADAGSAVSPTKSPMGGEPLFRDPYFVV